MGETTVRCPMCGSTDLVPEGHLSYQAFLVGWVGVRTKRWVCASCGYVLTRVADAAEFRAAREVRGWRAYLRYMRDRMNWRRRLRAKRGQCLACGYDLRASPGDCPECGARRPVTK